MRTLTNLVLVFIFCAAFASPSFADTSDFETAKTKAKALGEKLQSYEIHSTLEMEQKPVGAPQGMKFEATQVAAARMPDRLMVKVESPMFEQTWGTGAESAWFYFGQMQTCYQGPPAELMRELGGEPSGGLDESEIYNFYAGVGEYLLSSDVAVKSEVGTAVLPVNGGEASCQVFTFDVLDEAGGSKGHGSYWFDPQSGLVLKASVTTLTSQNGQEIEGTMTSTITRFTLNEKVDEALFAYNPKEGTRVVDSFEKLMNPDSLVGEVAPEITFTTFEGGTVNLSDYRGKVVFLDFWATWCGPCRMEMPHIQALHDEMVESGDVIFIGASNEPKNTILGWLEKNPYSFPIVMVQPEDAQGKFKVTSIPAGFVIDREGVIRAHMIGAQSEEQLRAALGKAGIN
jgi:thiol-disulfide isomerase/thioredoxin/outer membrane lipoprotein-sorting protein